MADRPARYVGRFAPSPTGPLHAGSLATALASRLDALAHGGRWLLRIEDLDPPRERRGAAEDQIASLEALGFVPDGPIVRQRARADAYASAFAALDRLGLVFGCACSRSEIAAALARGETVLGADGEPVYPGTCRTGLPAGRAARAWRLRVGNARIRWRDRPGGYAGGAWQSVALGSQCGDFVLRRADGPWAYQLAVVVDDADAGVTDVVRGADLVGSTARQCLLQRLLGLPRPRYLHLPIVLGPDGRKLAKSNGAARIDLSAPLEALERAGAHLGLPRIGARTIDDFWQAAIRAWAESPRGAPVLRAR